MDRGKSDGPTAYIKQIESEPSAGPNLYMPNSAGAEQPPSVGTGSYQPPYHIPETSRGIIYMHEQRIQHVQYTNVERQQPRATITVVQKSPPPPNYMIPSVVACLCCFWPTALCAIVYSLKSTSLANGDDMNGAQRASVTARNLMISSFVIGVILYILTVALVVSARSSRY